MCSEGLTKWGLVLLNIAFFLVGGVVLGIGIWLHVDSSSFAVILQNVPTFGGGLSLFKTASLVFILVGSISFIPALFGCCGACLKIRLFLVVYVIILAVFLLAELAFVVAVVVKKDEVKGFVRNLANESLSSYVDGLRLNGTTLALPSSAQELAWDSVHIQLECCGVDGPGNFLYDAPKFEQTFFFGVWSIEAVVPFSCCTLKDKTLFPSAIDKIEFKYGTNYNACLKDTEKDVTNQQGCETALLAWADSQFLYIIIAGVVVVLLELIGMVCGIKLFRTVNGESEKV